MEAEVEKGVRKEEELAFLEGEGPVGGRKDEEARGTPKLFLGETSWMTANGSGGRAYGRLKACCVWKV